VKGKLLAVILALAAPSAVSAEETLTSEDIWSLVGEEYGLAMQIRSKTFEERQVRDQMRRIGISRSCPLISTFIQEEARLRRQPFRETILSEITRWSKSVEQSEYLAFSPNGGRFHALIRGVERRNPEIFAGAYAAIETKLVPVLEREADIGDDWQGPVSGWDFDGPNQTIWGAACTVANHANPSAARVAFDGFFMRKRTQ
jgi:hypothetical protein